MDSVSGTATYPRVGITSCLGVCVTLFAVSASSQLLIAVGGGERPSVAGRAFQF